MLKAETKHIPTHNQVVIQITPTSSDLDQSQELIKDYLSDRCAERGTKGLTTGNAGVLIDIGILGIGKESPRATANRGPANIYPVRVYQSTVLLGPIYSIGGDRGPCPLCLERRWLAIRPQKEQEAVMALQRAIIFGSNPRLIQSTLEFIWTVVEETLYQRDAAKRSRDSGSLYALQLDTLRLTRHELIADSDCPVCAHPELDTPEAAVLHLGSRIKRSELEYHLVKPQEYKLPEAGYINPACGMLGSMSISDRTHTVTAPVGGSFLLSNRGYLHEVGWGGHTTQFQMSRLVGLLEALERYAGHWPRARKIAVVDSYENLAPDALDPRTCGLYHSDKHQTHAYYQPFSVDARISWVWGYSFLQARPILVPLQLAYYGQGKDEAPPFVFDCSNGCAIGSCMEEAILFGLLELIERDNFLLCWYAKLAPPRIDAQSSRSSSTLHLLDRLDREGYDVHFLDTRLDTELPTITAMGVSRKDELGKLVLAAGVGLDPEEAIRSALCEVAAYAHSMGDRVQKDLDHARSMAQDFTKVTSLHDHALLYGLPEMAQHADFLLQNPHLHSIEEAYKVYRTKYPPNRDLLDDLQRCIDIIAKLGMDIIVVDQTCPELEGTGLKVANVIVPGLLPIDFGWGRHRVSTLPRLRTVPHTAGFLSQEFDPSLLNLTPHPFP